MDIEMAAAYEIIWAGRQHDRAWNSRLEAVIKSLAGRML